MNGRLPTEEEYMTLNPDPDFELPWIPKAPESDTSFLNTEQTPNTILDPFLQPFIYEVSGDSFLIRSLGIDGVRSRDDIVYSPSED